MSPPLDATTSRLPSEQRAVYLRAVFASLLAAVLLVPLGLWARHLDVGPGVVPVYDAEGRSYWLVGLGISLLLGLLFQLLERGRSDGASGPRVRKTRDEPASELPTAWIFPLVTTMAVVMLLAVYHSLDAILGCALAAFLFLGAGAIVRYHLFDQDAAARQRARGIYTILIHIIAFVALSMVYINKVRSLFSATAVLLLGILLLLQLTEGEDAPFARRLVYAIVGGVMLGQVTWVLNYWKATGWTGGAALLVFFYLAAGLILSQLRGGVSTRDLVEYGGVSTVAFAIVIYSLFA